MKVYNEEQGKTINTDLLVGFAQKGLHIYHYFRDHDENIWTFGSYVGAFEWVEELASVMDQENYLIIEFRGEYWIEKEINLKIGKMTEFYKEQRWRKK